jgi:hypothetical protein
LTDDERLDQWRAAIQRARRAQRSRRGRRDPWRNAQPVVYRPARTTGSNKESA